MAIDQLQLFFRSVQELVFLYPFTMSWIWIAGALMFYLFRERGQADPDEMPDLKHTPMVTLLIPCHNEGKQIEETIASLVHTNYPVEKFEVIAVNDGSSDDTAEKLNNLVEQYSFLRVVHLAENKGKALALRTGCLMAQGAGETALKYGLRLFSKDGQRMLPILFEYLFSMIWAHAILITGCGILIEALYSFDLGFAWAVPSHWSVLMGVTFFLQSLVSMSLERRYEPDYNISLRLGNCKHNAAYSNDETSGQACFISIS